MAQNIPIDTVEPDKLPREKGFTYDEIAKIVGSLYLDSHHRISIIEEQFNSIIQELNNKIASLQAENSLLKSQLRDNIDGPNTTGTQNVPNNSRQNKGGGG